MQQRESIQTYLQAIEIYNSALRFAPNDFKTLKCLGMANEKLYSIQLEQQEHLKAIEALKNAIAAYETAFSQTANDALNISYLGMHKERLAELQSEQKQYAEAFQSYQHSFATYDSAIKLDPLDSSNYALKAGALTSLADLYSSLSQYTQALEHYQEAIVCYETSLKFEYFKGVEFDKARTLQKLGNCLEQLSRQEEVALSCYQAAMEICCRLLPANDQHILSLEQQMEKLSQQ